MRGRALLVSLGAGSRTSLCLAGPAFSQLGPTPKGSPVLSNAQNPTVQVLERSATVPIFFRILKKSAAFAYTVYILNGSLQLNYMMHELQNSVKKYFSEKN